MDKTDFTFSQSYSVQQQMRRRYGQKFNEVFQDHEIFRVFISKGSKETSTFCAFPITLVSSSNKLHSRIKPIRPKFKEAETWFPSHS